jgi:hypothetical protein
LAALFLLDDEACEFALVFVPLRDDTILVTVDGVTIMLL